MARPVSPARGIFCSTCHAGPGERCTAASGFERGSYHKARRDAATQSTRGRGRGRSAAAETPKETITVSTTETPTQRAERLEKELQELKQNVIDIYKKARQDEDWCSEGQQRIAEQLQEVGIEVAPVDGYLTIKVPVTINRENGAERVSDWSLVDMETLQSEVAEYLSGGDDLDLSIRSTETYIDTWGTYRKHLNFELPYEMLKKKIEVTYSPAN